MRGMPDAELRRPGRDGRGGPAGARARRRGIQAPPNLVGDEFELLLRAGIDDWGGVSPLTPDHVNPERPWPQIDELAAPLGRGRVHAARAAHRSTRSTCGAATPWLDPRLAAARGRAGRPGDRAGRARTPGRSGRPWQEPDGGFAAAAGPTCTPTIDTDRAAPSDRRGDFDIGVRRLGRAARRSWPASRRPAPVSGSTSDVRGRAARWPRRDPAALLDPAHDDGRAGAVHRRRPGAGRAGPARRRRCAATRSATTSPTWSTATSTSPTSATWAAGSARSPSASATPTRTGCRSTQVADRAEEAWRGRRDRGLHAGRHRPEAAGHRVRRPGPRGARAAVPGMHVHAFSPDGDRHRRGQGRRVDPRLAHRAARRRAGHDPRHRRGDPRRRRALGADQGQAAGGRLGRGGRAPRTSWASGPARR